MLRNSKSKLHVVICTILAVSVGSASLQQAQGGGRRPRVEFEFEDGHPSKPRTNPESLRNNRSNYQKGYVIGTIIGGLIKRGIENRQRNNRREQRNQQRYPKYYPNQRRQRYPQQQRYFPKQQQFQQYRPQPISQVRPNPQPVVSPVTYSRPVVEPKTVPRTNMLPVIKATTKSNELDSDFALASDDQLTTAADDLDQSSRTELEDIKTEQDKNVETKAREVVADVPLTPAEWVAYAEASSKGDVEKVKDLLSKVVPPPEPAKVDALIAEMNTANSINSLIEKFDSGATASEMETEYQDLVLDLKSKLAINPEASQLISRLDSVNTKLLARDAIDNILANGSNPVFPEGPTDIVGVPGLPEGTVAVSPDGQMIQGMGDTGELTITEGTSAELFGISTPSGDILPDVSEEVLGVSNGILLRNAKSTQVSIHFTISGQAYELKSGESKRLNGNGNNVIEFDRGGTFGTARYTLAGGTFEFNATEKGWELLSKTFSITIDNSENTHAFLYVVNGTSAEVAAGEKKKHEGKYPFVVEFDRGDNGEPARKEMDNGTYRVGLDVSKSQIELFDAKKVTLSDASNRSRTAPKPKSRSSRHSRRRSNLANSRRETASVSKSNRFAWPKR